MSSSILRTTKLTANILRSSVPGKTITATTTYNSRTFQSTAVRMGVHNVANKAEFDSALKDNKVVVLDAFATWCGPCKVIAPTVAKFSEEYAGAHFIKIDVDEVPDVAQELNIRAMPTFIVFKNGEKVSEIVGANPKSLLAAIQEHTKEEK